MKNTKRFHLLTLTLIFLISVSGQAQDQLGGLALYTVRAEMKEDPKEVLREEANISLPQIGEVLGGRDHTTVMYGCDKINDMLERDDRLRRQVIEIKEKLYGTGQLGATRVA